MEHYMNTIKGISVVVPVYNSTLTLEQLTVRMAKVLSKLTKNFELILVNDHSLDQSWQVIEKLVKQYPWVVGVDLMRNFGQHNALLCGIRVSTQDIIITMDDDLQHPPEEIGKLLEELAKGYDVVYGTPIQDQHTLWRNLTSKITKLVLRNAMNTPIAPQISSFRAFRSHLCNAFADYKNHFVLLDVLLAWSTSNFSSVNVRHDPRYSGKSTYNLKKLIIHSLNLITGFSDLPLRLASILGFVFAFFGFIVLIIILAHYFIEGGVVAGFPFLASTIAIFSGVQLFALGIIGEYLARIYQRTMDRPTYSIRRLIKNTHKT
jgi:undecaprenyl-phosphate 4-deoxy-4-formamido-L-arabinose transferase